MLALHGCLNACMLIGVFCDFRSGLILPTLP